MMFVNRIIECKQLIPYGLLLIAKELKHSLHSKFRDAHEKEILKVGVLLQLSILDEVYKGLMGLMNEKVLRQAIYMT